ncbi:2-oxoacid:acceptor oxidoreductase family protein [Pseudothermotoga thermarum]|uniref:Pyruvate/ketoisovalerate oxidoreductase, gamma subunit n=1 Tax=Pseudothermotoga thermarum DSM 5069 TaxID=688269 RepID=F7YYI2_9THEM|nr:2-oxoacid:acceptor oxidoreductase family protein [Pseudothermotoga thermarum]AEH51010.1 pyruvate/ketoisovalerate oxidoreductase, gamma subunit [Pseudothermotoga thermarum DSM 5069]
MRLEEPVAVRIAGVGGQGNILVGKILAQAAMYDGKYVIQTQLYGAEARGGLTHCDLLIHDEWIDYPLAEQFEIMYIMHPKALKEYQKALKPNGIVLLDVTHLEEVPKQILSITRKIIQLPLEKMAIEKFNTATPANMIGLGALVRATKLVSYESLMKAIQEMVPEKYLKMNLEAVEYGYKSVNKEYKLKSEIKIRTIGFE